MDDLISTLKNDFNDLESTGLVADYSCDLTCLKNMKTGTNLVLFLGSNIGNMDFFFILLKYGLSDIVPMTTIPLDMSVQVIYHTYSIENWLNSGTFAMNLQTSTDLKVIPLNIYGGIGYESTSLKLSTDEIFDIGSSAVGDISINGQNKLRGTLGAGITFWLLNIHAEYNFGVYNSAAAGAMIVF